MKNTHININIKDPERWRLKYTEKRKHYFQFHSSWWADSTYLALNNDEKVIFSWLISQTLGVNKPSISVCLDHVKGLLSMELDLIKDAIRTLKDNDFIELETRVRKSNKSQYKEEKRKEEKRREEKNKSICAKAQISYTQICEEILDCWNRNAPQYNLPTVKNLNATRLKKLQSALKDFNKTEDWIKIFSVASTKGFIGKDGREFIPSWDYVFRNNNYASFYDEYDVLFNRKKDNKQIQEKIEKDLINNLMV